MLTPQLQSDYGDHHRHPFPLILGVPRSGTTMVRMILDAHPLIAIPPETHFLPRLLDLAEESTASRDEFVRIITESKRWSDFNMPAEALIQELSKDAAFTVPDGIRGFYRLYAARYGKPMWGDKTPSFEVVIKQLSAILPEAHFIHVVRDGRDAFVSLRKTWWGRNTDAAEHAHAWRQSVLEARYQGSQVPFFLEIRFEEAVFRLSEVAERLSAFLNIKCHPAMLQYYERVESRLDEISDLRSSKQGIISKAQRLSVHAQLSHPPDTLRIGAWKGEMSAGERATYWRVAGTVLKEYGYSSSEPSS